MKKYICPDCGGEMEQVSRAVPNDADILIYQCTECPYSQEEEPEAEEEVYICELCQKAYEPKGRGRVKFLRRFKGYTVDLRVQEFRKWEYGKEPKFIDFASSDGKKLLAQMHERVTR